MRSQSGGWADGEAEERPVEGGRLWRRATMPTEIRWPGPEHVWPANSARASFVPRRASFVPFHKTEELRLSLFILQKSFVWPFLIKLSQTLSCNGRGGSLFFFRPAGARDRVCHPPACPPTPQQRAKRSYHAMFSAARPDLRVTQPHALSVSTAYDAVA